MFEQTKWLNSCIAMACRCCLPLAMRQGIGKLDLPHTVQRQGARLPSLVNMSLGPGVTFLTMWPFLRRNRCGRSGSSGNKDVMEFLEVELQTDEPEAVSEIFFAMGASSASSRELAEGYVVTAQFDHQVDLAQCSAILMRALDLPEPPNLSLRGLGVGTWINHFPLSHNFVVRLPFHRNQAGGATPLYLEGSTAFGAGQDPVCRNGLPIQNCRSKACCYMHCCLGGQCLDSGCSCANDANIMPENLSVYMRVHRGETQTAHKLVWPTDISLQVG